MWPVLTNQIATWLANWLPPLTCCCADQSQFIQDLSFIKCGWLLPCFMDAPLLQSFTLLWYQKVFTFLLKIDFCACCALFLLMKFHKFLEQNRCFTLKMEFSLWGIFISPVNDEHQVWILCHFFWRCLHYGIQLMKAVCAQYFVPSSRILQQLTHICNVIMHA